MFNLINDIGDKMIKYMNSLTIDIEKEGLEAKELAAKFTTDCVASCAFGLDGRSFVDAKPEFREMGKKFISPSFWTGIKHMMLFILPSLANVFRIK